MPAGKTLHVDGSQIQSFKMAAGASGLCGSWTRAQWWLQSSQLGPSLELCTQDLNRDVLAAAKHLDTWPWGWEASMGRGFLF
jgi:hypothetical protein